MPAARKVSDVARSPEPVPGVWYRTGDGVNFRLAGEWKWILAEDMILATVELRDGSVVDMVIAMKPVTECLPDPSFFSRALDALTDVAKRVLDRILCKKE